MAEQGVAKSKTFVLAQPGGEATEIPWNSFWCYNGTRVLHEDRCIGNCRENALKYMLYLRE